MTFAFFRVACDSQGDAMIHRCILTLCLLAFGLSPQLFAQDDLKKDASWTIPSAKQIREQILFFANEIQANELSVTKLELLWSDQIDGQEQALLLRQYIESISILYPQLKPKTDLILSGKLRQTDFHAELLSEDLTKKIPGPVRANLKLAYGVSLAKEKLFDESISILDEVVFEDVADPASLLFYTAVCQQQLLKKNVCIKTLQKLLENEAVIPTRYREISRLMLSDIKPLKTDSLDEISRLMADIRRRQKLHRSGKVVRKEEDDVVAKLEKMIKAKEEQLKKQQQQSSGGGQGGSPMQDSTPGGGTGPGDVDRKFQEDGGDWGDLPAKAREAAMADLVKDLPPHYRQVIEEYFKKLAREEPNR